MHQIITSIQVVNDVLAPIRLLSNARPRKKGRKGHTRSLYREILFLSFVACGRNFIDLGKNLAYFFLSEFYFDIKRKTINNCNNDILVDIL